MFLAFACIAVAQLGNAQSAESAPSEPKVVTQQPINHNAQKKAAIGPANRQSTGEATRGFVAQRYLSFVNKTDNFFSGKRLEQDTNNSFLKAEYQVTGFERSETESDFRVRAKLDLPGTKKRLRLFIDSDLEQDQAIDSRGRGVASGRNVDEQNTSAGLELFRSNNDKFKKTLQFGVRTGSSLRPFIRYRLRNSWQISKSWRLNLKQDFWHLDEVGFGETTRLEFQRSFGERFNLRIHSELEYRDEPDPLQYLHEWILGQRLNDSAALIYRAGGLGRVRKDEFAREQFLAVTYRRLIYQDWAYLNFTPRLIFSDVDPWSHEGAFSIRLEVFFTDNKR